jgi:hypothetical protein
MKANTGLLWLLSGFFALSTVAYGVWYYLEDPETFGWIEGRDVVGLWTGLIALGLSAILAGFIAFYLGRVTKAQGGDLPEDILTAEIDDADPELGHFSPWSWWPIVLGAGIATVFLGLAVGPWLAMYAFPIVLIALVGWTFEYYRGYFGR